MLRRNATSVRVTLPPFDNFSPSLTEMIVAHPHREKTAIIERVEERQTAAPPYP